MDARMRQLMMAVFLALSAGVSIVTLRHDDAQRRAPCDGRGGTRSPEAAPEDGARPGRSIGSGGRRSVRPGEGRRRTTPAGGVATAPVGSGSATAAGETRPVTPLPPGRDRQRQRGLESDPSPLAEGPDAFGWGGVPRAVAPWSGERRSDGDAHVSPKDLVSMLFRRLRRREAALPSGAPFVEPRVIGAIAGLIRVHPECAAQVAGEVEGVRDLAEAVALGRVLRSVGNPQAECVLMRLAGAALHPDSALGPPALLAVVIGLGGMASDQALTTLVRLGRAFPGPPVTPAVLDSLQWMSRTAGEDLRGAARNAWQTLALEAGDSGWMTGGVRR